VSARTRNLLLGSALAALVLGLAGARPIERLLFPAAPLEVTPALVADGRAVLERRCLGCHRDVPLAPRVRGWDVHRAYDAIGRLPELYRGMPPFPGTDEERRALAAYLASVGAGEAR
jgi:mono/diheme cytochrome c family protein